MLDFGDITEAARNSERKDGLTMILAERPVTTDCGMYQIRLCWNPATDASAVYAWDRETGAPITNIAPEDRASAAHVYTHPIMALGLA